MKAERAFPSAVVTKKAERSLKEGHVWVYDAEITAWSAQPENGALVDREKTAEELARERKGELRRQIAKLKEKLTRTTTEAIMYLEGILIEEQYAPIKAQRQAWQDEINALEEEMKKL